MCDLRCTSCPIICAAVRRLFVTEKKVRAAIYLSMWRGNAVAHATSFRSAERGRLWQRITCKGLISIAGATQAPLRVIGPGNAPVSGAVMAVMVCWPERFRPMNPRFSGRADSVPVCGPALPNETLLPNSLGPLSCSDLFFPLAAPGSLASSARWI